MVAKPNILFLFPDQLRWDFLSCYGAQFISTPNIDRLAAKSTVFERAISPHPVCIPARAALLTGCNALTTGVLTNNYWLRPDHEACGMPSWPSLLSEAGYHTEAIGKMHFIPWDSDEGFDHRVIAEDKRHIHIEDDYARYLAQHDLKKVRGWEEEGYTEFKMASISDVPTEHQVDVWTGREAAQFLESYKSEKPFALHVAFPGPHDPYNPPREWAERFRYEDMPPSLPRTEDTDRFLEGWIKSHAGGSSRVDLSDFPESTKQRVRVHYCALIAMIDEQVGAILDALEARGDADNTMIVFAADHGDFVGDFDFIGKNLFFEAAMHVPMLLHMPGQTAAKRSNALVTVTDLFASFLEVAGLDNTTGKESYALPGIGTGEPRQYALGAVGNGVMITDGRFRLSHYTNGLVTLYDLDEDPTEARNLANDPGKQDLRSRLDAALVQEMFKATANAHEDKRYPYTTMTEGHPAHQRGWRRTYPWDRES